MSLTNDAALYVESAWTEGAIEGVEYNDDINDGSNDDVDNTDADDDVDNPDADDNVNNPDADDDVNNLDVDDNVDNPNVDNSDDGADNLDEEMFSEVGPIIVTTGANRRRTVMLALLQYITAAAANTRTPPQPLHFSMAGRAYMETFSQGPDTMWLETFRMTKRAYYGLLNWLDFNTDLGGSYFISLHEKLFIFLYMICQGITQTAAAYFFGHSDETIFR